MLFRSLITAKDKDLFLTRSEIERAYTEESIVNAAKREVVGKVIKNKLSESQIATLQSDNNYLLITPTLKALPLVLEKYKKNPISLSEPVKLDGAKAPELRIMNVVRELIKENNPSLRSISASDFVNEVHNWLEANYYLGFADEKQWLSYRIDQTFEIVPDRYSDEDIDLTDMTEDQFRELPYEERQRIIRVLGADNKERQISHKKISLRFNNEYFRNSDNHHYTYAPPSAFGTLTYFYTGKSGDKDAVLLHEIQNDNIENLRKSYDSTDPETVINKAKESIFETFENNVNYLTGALKYSEKVKDLDWKIYNLPIFHKKLHGETKLGRAISRSSSFENFKEIVDEEINLAQDRLRWFDEEHLNKRIDGLYSAKRAAEELFKKDLVQMLEVGFERKGTSFDPFDSEKDIDSFTSAVREQNEAEIPFGSKPILSLKPIIDYIDNNYSGDTKKELLLYFPTHLEAKFLPRTNYTKFSANIKSLLYHAKQLTLKRLYATINSYKEQRLVKVKAERSIASLEPYLSIDEDQYNQIKSNLEYNAALLDKYLLEAEQQANLAIASGKEASIAEEEQRKNKALQKLEGLSEGLRKELGGVATEVRKIIDVELGYFNPLVHQLIQTHIREKGRDFPMYFSGYKIGRAHV